MAFPINGVIDNFNRADGDLGITWSGPSFGDANNLTIVSNTVTSAANAFGSQMYNIITVNFSYEIYITVPTLPAAGKTVRVVSYTQTTGATGNGYYLVLTPSTGSWQLSDAGTGGNIGAAISQAFSAGDSFGFNRDLSGLITIWYKAGASAWATIGTRTDTKYNGPFYLGLELEDNTQRLDSFGGGSLGGSLTSRSGFWGDL